MRADPGYRGDYDPNSLEDGPSRRIRTIAWAVAIVALGAFSIVIWYAYNLGIKDGTESVAPLIRADARPTKIKPEQPGGMAVPHQDKEVYETMGSGGGSEPKVERLLPPAEQPISLPPPAPLPGSTAQAPAGGNDVASPPPSDELRALMEREGLTPKSDGQGQDDRPTPPKSDVGTAPAATLDPQVASKPPAETAAKPAPAPKATGSADLSGRWRIQLAAHRDRPTVESEWGRLQKKYPDLLGALALEVQKADLGDKGTFYRMRGGPIADEASAKLLCAQLEQRKQGCLVVRP